MKKRVLPALVLSALGAVALPQQADAAQFTGVYVFGDSLSDAGYYRGFLASLGLPSNVVSQLGRFTTNPGPVWSELVTQYYGYAPGPSNAGGNIYAQGGANVASSSTSTPPGAAQRPVSTQITEYLATSSGRADPGALYAVWAGGNDFLQGNQRFAAGQITSAELQATVVGAATTEVGQIARLQAAGARYIMVFGLPDIGLTPTSAAGGPAAIAGATALSAGYNTALFTGLKSAGINVIPVDTFAFLNDVKNNAAAFGFTNTTGIACGPFPGITTTGSAQFCLQGVNLVAPNANNTYLFADGVHPTSGAQRILADFVIQELEGPTQYGLLAEAALANRGSHMRMLNDGIARNRSDGGAWGIFAATDGQNMTIESGRGNYGFDGRVKSLAVGATVRASDAVMIGVAFGQSFNTGSFGMDAGNFKMKEKVASLFASARAGGFYGNAVVSLADLNFNEVKRNIQLGDVRRTAYTHPEGSNGSASLAAGYDFKIGRLEVGPTVGVTTQSVTINGFTESAVDAGSAALRIYEQSRKSEIWSVGGRASVNLGQWTPWARVTADKERRDEERLVGATPLTLDAIGNRYDLPAYRPDSTFVTTALGVTGSVGQNVGLSGGYFRVSGRNGIKQDGLNLLVSLRF